MSEWDTRPADRICKHIAREEAVREAGGCDLCNASFGPDGAWRCHFWNGATMLFGGDQPERFIYWFLCEGCYPQLDTHLALAALWEAR